MLAVEEGLVERLHAVEHRLVGVFLGTCQVFPLAKQLVGIEQRLVHAAVFAVEESLEVAFRNLAHHVDAPVGQLAEHLLGLFAVAIDIGVAQACQNLMLAIERHPSPVVADGGEVAAIELLPRLVDGLAANEAIEAFRIVVVGILTVFHDVEHIVQTLFQTGLRICIMTGGIGQRQGRYIVASHMSAEVEAGIAAPVPEVGVLLLPAVVGTAGIACGRESCLTYEWCEQAVCVVLHQHLNV